MIVEFDKSFEKSLDRIGDHSLYLKIEKFIETMESSKSLNDLTHIKKLSGFKTYFRFRIGNYRLGFEKISETTVRLIIIAHRKDIYKHFP